MQRRSSRSCPSTASGAGSIGYLGDEGSLLCDLDPPNTQGSAGMTTGGKEGSQFICKSLVTNKRLWERGGGEQRVEQSELSAADEAVRQPCEIISRYPQCYSQSLKKGARRAMCQSPCVANQR